MKGNSKLLSLPWALPLGVEVPLFVKMLCSEDIFAEINSEEDEKLVMVHVMMCMICMQCFQGFIRLKFA